MSRSGFGAGVTALVEGVGIALESLRANKTRAALTILGIAIGVMVVMAMAATVKGINSTVDNILEQTGPTTFFVVRFEGGNQADDDESDPPWWRYPPLTPEEATLIRRLPDIEAVSMEDNNARQIFAGAQDASAQIFGRSASWMSCTRSRGISRGASGPRWSKR